MVTKLWRRLALSDLGLIAFAVWFTAQGRASLAVACMVAVLIVVPCRWRRMERKDAAPPFCRGLRDGLSMNRS